MLKGQPVVHVFVIIFIMSHVTQRILQVEVKSVMLTNVLFTF